MSSANRQGLHYLHGSHSELQWLSRDAQHLQHGLHRIWNEQPKHIREQQQKLIYPTVRFPPASLRLTTFNEKRTSATPHHHINRLIQSRLLQLQPFLLFLIIFCPSTPLITSFVVSWHALPLQRPASTPFLSPDAEPPCAGLSQPSLRIFSYVASRFFHTFLAQRSTFQNYLLSAINFRPSFPKFLSLKVNVNRKFSNNLSSLLTESLSGLNRTARTQTLWSSLSFSLTRRAGTTQFRSFGSWFDGLDFCLSRDGTAEAGPTSAGSDQPCSLCAVGEGGGACLSPALWPPCLSMEGGLPHPPRAGHRTESVSRSYTRQSHCRTTLTQPADRRLPHGWPSLVRRSPCKSKWAFECLRSPITQHVCGGIPDARKSQSTENKPQTCPRCEGRDHGREGVALPRRQACTTRLNKNKPRQSLHNTLWWAHRQTIRH